MLSICKKIASAFHSNHSIKFRDKTNILLNSLKHTDAKSKVLIMCDKFWDNVNPLDESLSKYIIDINDEEYKFSEIMQDIDDNRIETLYLIIDTCGGDIASNDRIVSNLMTYVLGGGLLYSYIPRRVYSAGSMIALIGKKIFMQKYAVFGPTDPQIQCCVGNDNGNSNGLMYSSETIKKSFKSKNSTFHDRLIYYDAMKYHDENITNTIEILLGNGYSQETIANVIEHICSGIHSHSRPFSPTELKKIGLNIEMDFPEKIKEISDNFFMLERN